MKTVEKPGAQNNEIPHAFNNGEQYSIPLRYRKMENLHIFFWLLKDISWCMTWRFLGIAMIFPTLIIAIVITWRTRHSMSEWAHNLAIVLWISANSYWMISEFFHFDEMPAFAGITYKFLAVVPFIAGIIVLAWFYLWYAPMHKKREIIKPV
jgi:H+/Cl- antiporter ClcA